MPTNPAYPSYPSTRRGRLACALALAFNVVAGASGAQAGVDTYVHIAGGQPVDPARSSAEGANPQIEKLLNQPADLWERIRLGFALPELERALVARQIAWYAARPELVQAIVLRARLYLHFIVDAVERRGLPTELALLPFVESGFNPMALSSAQASGLWQFIPETGAKYKLTQNLHYDGRRDVVASTGAALDYLEFLYQFNQRDWHRALASYNWGEFAVARAVERNRARGLPEAYASLSLPEETRNYVPRLLAIKHIVNDPQSFGIRLTEIPNEPVFGVVAVAEDLDLVLAAQFAHTPLAEFLALNPAFNGRHVAGAGGSGSGLVIPLDKAELFKTNLERHRESLAAQSKARPAAGKTRKTTRATRF